MLDETYHRALQWLETATDLCEGDAGEVAWVKLITGGCLTDIGHYGQARPELEGDRDRRPGGTDQPRRLRTVPVGAVAPAA